MNDVALVAPKYIPSDRQDNEEVNMVITSGNIINLSLYKNIEGFNEELFVDFVDFDLCYQIKEKGLIISEYPNKSKPLPYYFLIRNRLIAAISEHICVIEANYKSGTMNTVAYGLEYGKDICCVPSLANNNSGCNKLIKEGAKLVENLNDILEG